MRKVLTPTASASASAAPISARRGLLIGTSALSAAALAMTLALPRDASAALITYTFSNNASLTFSDGNVEDVSGSFVLNTTGGVVSNANITLSGAAPEAGTYDANPFYDTSAGPAVCGSPSGNFPLLCMWFQTPLGGSTTTSALIVSPPSGVGYFPTNPGTNITETAVDGGVSSVAAVPEPSSVALFAGAAGLFGLRRRLGKIAPRLGGSRDKRGACPNPG
ncbi:MAG TPA: PEP-CTERM sorting domain-containing protein [Acetobacteraceae bacterium]|jgi:hypothetical protein